MVQTKWGPRTASWLVAGHKRHPGDSSGPDAGPNGSPYALFDMAFFAPVPELDAGPSYLYWGRSAPGVGT
jgi:hypothetical protein